MKVRCIRELVTVDPRWQRPKTMPEYGSIWTVNRLVRKGELMRNNVRAGRDFYQFQEAQSGDFFATAYFAPLNGEFEKLQENLTKIRIEELTPCA